MNLFTEEVELVYTTSIYIEEQKAPDTVLYAVTATTVYTTTDSHRSIIY